MNPSSGKPLFGKTSIVCSVFVFCYMCICLVSSIMSFLVFVLSIFEDCQPAFQQFSNPEPLQSLNLQSRGSIPLLTYSPTCATLSRYHKVWEVLQHQNHGGLKHTPASVL